MKLLMLEGTAIADVDSRKNTIDLLSAHKDEKMFVLVSQDLQTTTDLEKMTEVYYSGHKQEALDFFDEIKSRCTLLAKDLLPVLYKQTLDQLSSFFTEVEWMLHDKPVRNFAYYYDQIVCAGELCYSCIVSAYINEMGIRNNWLDVRDMIRTGNNFGEATIDLRATNRLISQFVIPLYDSHNIIVTQACIGATDENENTRLGKNGCDAAMEILASVFNASL